MSRRNRIGLILIVIIFCFMAKEARCSIVLKTLAVNPSKTKTQTAMLKAYLPKEATAEDVVDLGDLKIDYDIEKGLYFVYQKYELKPGESISREIEIKDIWVIPESEIDSLLIQANELAKKLKGTAYFDMAVVLQKDIESKTRDILERQAKITDALPQTHIGAYRKNIKILDSANDRLVRLENMATKTKITTGPKAERIHVKATWRLMIAMVVALGLLSVAFFIIWSRQAAVEGGRRKTDPVDNDTSL